MSATRHYVSPREEDGIENTQLDQNLARTGLWHLQFLVDFDRDIAGVIVDTSLASLRDLDIGGSHIG